MYESVICVGSVDPYYRRPDDDDYGEAVRFLAPGEYVETLRIAPAAEGEHEFNIVTGSSFAAPHVAGIAALFRSWKGRAVQDLRPLLDLNSLEGVCDNVPAGQPNRLINTGILLAASRKEPFLGAGTQPLAAGKCNDVAQGGRAGRGRGKVGDEL